MSHANELVANYIAAWNERDIKRRRDLVAKTWSTGGSYIDAHRNAEGHDAIDTMLDTADAPLYLGGTDFAVIGGDGRFTAVTGFVDAAPAPMN
jgi:hypothetical protein